MSKFNFLLIQNDSRQACKFQVTVTLDLLTQPARFTSPGSGCGIWPHICSPGLLGLPFTLWKSLCVVVVTSRILLERSCQARTVIHTTENHVLLPVHLSFRAHGCSPLLLTMDSMAVAADLGSSWTPLFCTMSFNSMPCEPGSLMWMWIPVTTFTSSDCSKYVPLASNGRSRTSNPCQSSSNSGRNMALFRCLSTDCNHTMMSVCDSATNVTCRAVQLLSSPWHLLAAIKCNAWEQVNGTGLHCVVLKLIPPSLSSTVRPPGVFSLSSICMETYFCQPVHPCHSDVCGHCRLSSETLLVGGEL